MTSRDQARGANTGFSIARRSPHSCGFDPKPFVFLAIAAASSLLSASCAVGPNFKKPAAPEVTTYTASPLVTTSAIPNLSGGEAQRFDVGSDLSADWWTLFRSPTINTL